MFNRLLHAKYRKYMKLSRRIADITKLFVQLKKTLLLEVTQHYVSHVINLKVHSFELLWNTCMYLFLYLIDQYHLWAEIHFPKQIIVSYPYRTPTITELTRVGFILSTVGFHLNSEVTIIMLRIETNHYNENKYLQ